MTGDLHISRPSWSVAPHLHRAAGHVLAGSKRRLGGDDAAMEGKRREFFCSILGGNKEQLLNSAGRRGGFENFFPISLFQKSAPSISDCKSTTTTNHNPLFAHNWASFSCFFFCEKRRLLLDRFLFHQKVRRAPRRAPTRAEPLARCFPTWSRAPRWAAPSSRTTRRDIREGESLKDKQQVPQCLAEQT